MSLMPQSVWIKTVCKLQLHSWKHGLFPSCLELLGASRGFSLLQDDIPPIYPTSPGPIPITLSMEHAVLSSEWTTVFHIGGE